MTLCKKEGGLGIWNAGSMNQALLCKAVWRIRQEKMTWANFFSRNILGGILIS